MNTSLSCLWMLHIIYKDVKQNWLPLAALPLGAAPWRVLDLIWGFLLIITRETQSSLNVQVTAKGNLSGSEERAVTVAVTFICFLHPLLSAQTCLEWAQLPTLIQCLGAQQCQTVLAPRSLWPWDTSSWGGSPVTASSALQHRVTSRRGQAQAPAQPPPRTVDTPGRRTVLIFEKGMEYSWAPASLSGFPLCVILWASFGNPRTWLQRRIQHKSLPCHLL